MRVLIAGMDGYLGWSLVQCLAARGHQVAGADLFLRRQWVEEMGSCSATPIVPMKERLAALKESRGFEPKFWEADLRDYYTTSPRCTDQITSCSPARSGSYAPPM